MALDWQELTRLTQGKKLEIERVRIVESGIAVEGSFEAPPLAQLTVEDQVFMIAFIRNHGSIKEMEQLFGVSYPTIKNRLNRIADSLEYVEINKESPASEGTTHKHVESKRKGVLEALEKGELSAAEAMKALKELKS